jgi:hypothetical protein
MSGAGLAPIGMPRRYRKVTLVAAKTLDWTRLRTRSSETATSASGVAKCGDGLENECSTVRLHDVIG